MTEHEIFLAMRKLLDKPEAWTKGSFAKGNLGELMKHDNRGAVCWCLGGAAMYCSSGLEDLDQAQKRIKSIIGGRIIPWNDAPERTHSDIIQLLDKLVEETRP